MGSIGNNFALTILKLLKEGKDISVIYDQIGSPTTTDSLATACWAIIKSKEVFNSFNNEDPIITGQTQVLQVGMILQFQFKN